ncbi:hypothetical protein MP638_002646 [Amoeboaphelidium occidentale]|nr:hypothetical protein MP638_002646 [Amoeboaphelidium occidentale]
MNSSVRSIKNVIIIL